MLFVASPLLFDLETKGSHEAKAGRVHSGTTRCEHSNSVVRERNDGGCCYCSADPAASMCSQHRSEVVVSYAIHNLPDRHGN